MGKQVPLESSVVATIIKKLNAVPGCRVKKFHGSAFGMMELDIYGCFNGRAVFIEVKRPGGKQLSGRNGRLKSGAPWAHLPAVPRLPKKR